jgi:hypothetical protein
MPKVLRALQVCFSLALVLSLALAVAAMRHTLPNPRLLGVIFFAFLFLAYVVVQHSVRNRVSALGAPRSQSATAPRNGFIRAASFRGWFALFVGAIAILLGVVTSRDKEAFLIAGVASCCWGCYFLFVGKKLRRGA